MVTDYDGLAAVCASTAHASVDLLLSRFLSFPFLSFPLISTKATNLMIYFVLSRFLSLSSIWFRFVPPALVDLLLTPSLRSLRSVDHDGSSGQLGDNGRGAIPVCRHLHQLHLGGSSGDARDPLLWTPRSGRGVHVWIRGAGAFGPDAGECLDKKPFGLYNLLTRDAFVNECGKLTGLALLVGSVVRKSVPLW